MAEHKRFQAYIYQAQLVKSENFWTNFPLSDPELLHSDLIIFYGGKKYIDVKWQRIKDTRPIYTKPNW